MKIICRCLSHLQPNFKLILIFFAWYMIMDIDLQVIFWYRHMLFNVQTRVLLLIRVPATVAMEDWVFHMTGRDPSFPAIFCYLSGCVTVRGWELHWNQNVNPGTTMWDVGVPRIILMLSPMPTQKHSYLLSPITFPSSFLYPSPLLFSFQWAIFLCLLRYNSSTLDRK